LNKIILLRNIIKIVQENIHQFVKFNFTLKFENISQNVPYLVYCSVVFVMVGDVCNFTVFLGIFVQYYIIHNDM